MAALAPSPLTGARPRAVLAGLVALTLIAGTTAAAVRAGDDDGHRAAAPTTTTSSSTSTSSVATTTTPPAVEDVVRRLQAFVESQRGLKYKAPVKVTLLDDAAFRARLKKDQETDREAIKNTEGELQALDLLRHGVDLEKELDSFTGAAVAGLYEPKTKELIVRGGRLTPYVREVLAHELTHALDDQWFGLYRPALKDADSEAQAGFDGLTEGDAVHVQEAYLRSLPSGERAAAVAEETAQGSSISPDIPEVVIQAITFPYQAGPRLITTLLDNGGRPRLDAAFGAPPLSTEQLIHPDRYLSGDKPKPVAKPAADGPAIDDDVMGELFLILTLEQSVPQAQALRAAQGWGGDHYVAWRSGGDTCLRDTFVMDTQRDDDELRTALQAWAADHAKATVTATGPITLTTCG